MSNPVLVGGQASGQSIYDITPITHPEHLPGTRGVLDDGRVFYYTWNESGVTYPIGQLLCTNDIVALHSQQVSGVVTAGSRRGTFTAGAVCVARQYIGGYMCVNDVTGQGQTYRIKDHPVWAAAAAQWYDLYDPLVVALDATSEITFVSSPYWTPQISVADQLDLPVGVATGIAITDDNCGWIQTWGEAAVLHGAGAAARGSCCTIGGAAVGRLAVKNADIEAHCATALILGVSTEYLPVCLQIRP